MRASERAYATLLDEIQTGALAPGTVLGEVEQSTRLGVSRTPLREALRRLASDGLIAQASSRVTVVAGIDAHDIRDLFDLRRALETEASRLAAQRGDRGVFQALAGEFQRVDTADAEDYYTLIARFDAAVDDAVDNAYLSSALRSVRTHLVRVRRMARFNPLRLSASAAEHGLVARAIGAGDPELAAHATHVHLHNALTTILEALTEDPS